MRELNRLPDWKSCIGGAVLPPRLFHILTTVVDFSTVRRSRATLRSEEKCFISQQFVIFRR